jgi:hypothetical protein
MKTVLAVVVLAALPLTGRADKLDVRTGAWEVTVTTTSAGIPIPADALAKMPPEQRARIEAMMGARAGKPNTRTLHSCVTPQDIDRGEMLGKDKEKNCTRKITAQTARHYEFDEVCTAPEPRKMHAKFDAQSAEKYSASFDGTQGEGKVHVEMQGRWIGAVCRKGTDD